MWIGQYNQFQQFGRSRSGQIRTPFISRPNRSRSLEIGNKPTQKMKWGLGSCKTMGILSFMDPMAIFRQIKAALTLGTGDGAYIIHGTGMKQKKYMLLLAVQAVSKAKAQKPPY